MPLGVGVLGLAQIPQYPQGQNLLMYLICNAAFVLSHEITMSVHNTKAVGSLIDSVIEAGGENLVINEIVWKAHK